MNLFIDAISFNGVLILFDDKKNIINKKDFSIKGNESSFLIPNIDNFLKNNNIKYGDLDNIVVVNGPGSFTGIRTIILTVNTINYITGKNLTDLSYFDLFNNYPIIKSSSKKDSFLKIGKDNDIIIIDNTCLVDFLKNHDIKEIYGDIDKEFFTNIKILDKIDYSAIINKIKFKNNKKLEALYLKKPNIS